MGTKLSTDNETSTDLESEVFKTLSHQVRRDILRFIGESKEAKFSEIREQQILKKAHLYHTISIHSLHF
ncbi:MAG: hypothetical protein BAJATHORv1_10554 [Candidatus Thorarchaeota archaeon]|nr:MAG: hypothetical protein BAJATHORv1_10554 [Candidatus Thorarchaeota archaeon]